MACLEKTLDNIKKRIIRNYNICYITKEGKEKYFENVYWTESQVESFRKNNKNVKIEINY